MTDKKTKEDLISLIDPVSAQAALPAIEDVGGYPERRGISSYAAPGVASGKALAGELKEKPGSREYHAERTVIPPGGYFAFVVSPIKTLVLLDEDDGEIKINFDEPAYDE